MELLDQFAACINIQRSGKGLETREFLT
jgi:hypothetical protein